ncbi:MAG: addiction module protein [Myxococcales bacterium]|nr:addiction module protein [Myxococcales bacterium]
MPLDDLRTRPIPPVPPHEEDVEVFDDDDVELTPEEQAAIDADWMEEIERRWKDYKEGREVALPWDDAMNARIFAKLR